MPRPQFCKMFTLETVAINTVREDNPSHRAGMDKYFWNEYIHFFLILCPCVKASSNLICARFCCVLNFIYKFYHGGGG